MNLCLVSRVVRAEAPERCDRVSFLRRRAGDPGGAPQVPLANEAAGRRLPGLGLLRCLGALLVAVALTASAQAQSSVTLAWDPSAGSNIAGYRLYQGAASRTYTNVINAGTATSNTVSVLVPGATYFFAATAVDTTGLESDYSSEVTYTVPVTTNPPPAVATIWPSTAVPGLVDGGADSPVELGVKFQSDVAGSIAGIRFYKSSANTGTHVGNLWSSAGTLLASATFTGETASGWEQVNFAAPVAIAANTVYVASYHASVGHYSSDSSYFLGKGVDNPPLHALADGVSGGDGVYAYGASSVFPNLSYNSRNYWVDVVWQAASAPPPSSPTVALTSPANGASYTAPATIPLAAGVTANGHTISQVQFYNGATLLGTVTAAPYTFSWANVAAGTYALSAKASYDAGSAASSATASVTVGTGKQPPRLRIGRGSGGTGGLAPSGQPTAAPIVLTATGEAGQTYNVQASPDCATWTTVGTLTVDASGSGQFTDSAGSSLPARFYRLQGQ